MAKTSKHVTAADRVKEFGKENFHCDSGILFCTSCNKSIDHTRRQTIVDHSSSAKHKAAEKKRLNSCSDVPAKKQCTVSGLFKQQSIAKEHRSSVIHDFTSMLVQANIPLEKADHPAVRQFLSAHVLNGGAIPKADCLRRLHLPRLMEEEEAKLHALFDGSSYICVIADESRDVKNRPVLNILFQTLTPIDKL